LTVSLLKIIFPQVCIIGLAESREAIIRYIEVGAAGYVHRQDSVDVSGQYSAAYNDEPLFLLSPRRYGSFGPISLFSYNCTARQELADTSELTGENAKC
jgi:hypothetical protein